MPGEYAVTAIDWGTVVVALAGIAGTWFSGASASKNAREMQKDEWAHNERSQSIERRRDIYAEFLHGTADVATSLAIKTFSIEKLEPFIKQLGLIQIVGSQPVVNAATDLLESFQDRTEGASQKIGDARREFLSAVRSELGVED